ncbi:MAG: hypothetical protein OEW67_11170 [Cyclobacteriaceae bacterium]|nr:hypothetical protein [Cyclobacteriaceae bacterium]
MLRNKFILYLLFNGVAFLGFGQEKESKVAFRGYLKNMTTVVQLNDSAMWYENLTHNRLNFSWYATDNFTVYLEARNRILVGDFVKELYPIYGEIIDGNNDYFNLSANVVDDKSLLINTMVDRLYMQWSKNDWEVKIGRQRVNWGINLAWNPNDIFNAYSFFDFDYEERRGVDAMRVIYYSGVASSWELAGKFPQNKDDWVGGGIRRVNRWGYDFQYLGGIAQGDFMLGMGWAGNIKLAGFKGELTYLYPIFETPTNLNYNYIFTGAVSFDYSFKNSLYLNGSVLYNSKNPIESAIGLGINGNNRDFTMRDLSNYRWSSFVQSAYQFSPLIFGSMSVMAFPATNAVFLNPSMSFSLTQNIDLGLFGQLFFDNDPITNDYKSSNPSGFLRLKWSF